jgi:tetratricopeptide (TPR) repeat protein
MPPTLSADTLLSRAKSAARAGDVVGAVMAYLAVRERFPSNRQVGEGLVALRPKLADLLAAAQAAQAQGAWGEAERQLVAAFALAPEVAQIGTALAACRLEMGRAPAALRAAVAVLARAPGDPAALNLKGRALREMGQAAAAEESLRAALGHPETEARTLNNLGLLARARGDRAAAADYFRRALVLTPADAGLHRNLASAITYTADEPHLAEMRERLAAIGPETAEAVPLHFALFKALDDLGQRQQAFSHLQTGNRLEKARLGYDFQTDALPYALSRALFKSVPEPVAVKTPASPRPVFVTGLPRSGTTLVERILSRAEGVQPCGELTVVQLAVGEMLREIMGREVRQITAADIASLRARLLEELAEYSDGSPVMIDKMPLDFRWIGYLCAALPEARIVHVARDPMAVAWSIYRLSFVGQGNAYAYDIGDIARFMVLHRDLMAHWRGLYPDRIFDLDYARLVETPDPATRDLAEAVGLDWSEDWLTPERAEVQALTASADQVRRPIYRGSDAGWRAYEAELAPLWAALQRVGLV